MQNFEDIIKKIFLTVILTVSTLALVKGQTATATIDDYAVTPGEIIIPVEVTNFNNVGAITIYIEYDQNVVTYQSFQNAALSGMQVNAFPSGNLYKIGISWTANSSGVNVTGTLLELVMNYSSGTTTLDFMEEICEIVDWDFNPIPVVYTDGSIYPENPVPVTIVDMTNQIPNTNILVPINVDFSSVTAGVGSFNFEILYDENYIEFQQILNPFEPGIIVNQLTNPSGIALIWTGTSGSNFVGKLLDMEFLYHGGTADLEFDTLACNISDFNAVTLNANYTNGTITQDPATITNITIDSIAAAAGSEILVPITVENFSNVGAFTYYINFDSQFLEFVELTSINNEIASGNLLYNALIDTLIIDWNAINNGVTLANGTALFSMKFNYSGTNTSLNFLEELCSMADYDTNPINAYYTDGKVTELPGENATASMDTIASPQQSQVLMPVIVTKFIDIGAITMEIEFDQTILQYEDLVNWNSDLLEHGSSMANAINGVLTISWTVNPSYGQGVTIPDNSKLFDIQFYYITGTSNLTFVTGNCAVANYNTEPINVYYSDGMVKDAVNFNIKALLQGSYNAAGIMNTTLNTKFLIPLNQPYNAAPWNYTGTESVTSIPNGDVVDWVLIEIRETDGAASTATEDKTIARQAGFMLKNGNIVGLDGASDLLFSIIPVNYLYVVVRHRNHLTVMSSLPIEMTGGIYTYDFTTALTQAYNNATISNTQMVDVGSGVYGLWAGDANTNGTVVYNGSNPDRVDILDYVGGVSNMTNVISNVYDDTDINMNGDVVYNGNTPDRVVILDNVGGVSNMTNTISTHVPY